MSVDFKVASYPHASYNLTKALEVYNGILSVIGGPGDLNVLTLSAVLNNVLELHEGNYTITAWNEYAHSRDWFFLEVLGELNHKLCPCLFIFELFRFLYQERNRSGVILADMTS